MIEDYARLLVKRIGEDITARQTALHAGACKSFDEYRELVGVLRGLTLAQQHVQDLANQMDNNDD